MVANLRLQNDSQLASLRTYLFKDRTFRAYGAGLLRGTKGWDNSQTTALANGHPVKNVFNIASLNAADMRSIAEEIYKNKDGALRNIIFGLIKGSRALTNSTSRFETVGTAPTPSEPEPDPGP